MMTNRTAQAGGVVTGAAFDLRKDVTVPGPEMRRLLTELAFLRGERVDLLKRVAELEAVLPPHLSASQVFNACLSYRHDYGIMDDVDASIVSAQCKDWWRCIRRAITGGEDG